ncbi:hypothetical protein SNEBB_003150 [Seison nebaliae]|nr:hypothetical protein SNEBB_003150 [Seison nebaliae]
MTDECIGTFRTGGLINGTKSSISLSINKMDEMMNEEIDRLRSELEEAGEKIFERDKQIEALIKVQEKLEKEYTELSAAVFEEANKQMNSMKLKEMSAHEEKKNAEMKIECMTTELHRLNRIIKEETIKKSDSMPKFFGSSQISPQSNLSSGALSNSSFISFVRRHRDKPKSHRRNHSSFISSFTGSTFSINDLSDKQISNVEIEEDFVIETNLKCISDINYKKNLECYNAKFQLKESCLYFKLFLDWKRNTNKKQIIGKDFQSNPFLLTLYDLIKSVIPIDGDIFTSLFHSIITHTIDIQPLRKNKNNDNNFTHSMKLDESCKLIEISEETRNKIIAICNLIDYLKYIATEVVKCNEIEMYARIIQHLSICLLSKFDFFFY